MKYIKVNLPANQEAYNSGNGEGVWCLVTEEVKKAHDADEEDTSYTAIIDNDSVYYPKLVHGTEIPIEMRGKKQTSSTIRLVNKKLHEDITEGEKI